jgi:cytochrome c
MNMKSFVKILSGLSLVISLVVVSSSASANQEAIQLFQKHGCTTCHRPNVKLIGPAYTEVAKRYAGQEGALETLVAKVKSGGSGNWGAVPMQAHPNVPDEDIKTIVTWVLSLAPAQAPEAQKTEAAPAEKKTN